MAGESFIPDSGDLAGCNFSKDSARVTLRIVASVKAENLRHLAREAGGQVGAVERPWENPRASDAVIRQRTANVAPGRRWVEVICG